MERSVLLLYMSPFGKNPNIHTQTNEAAVLKLKKHKEGPDCILALCSELVRTALPCICRTGKPAPPWSISVMYSCLRRVFQQSGLW